LVAETFSSARWHYEQQVAAIHGSATDRLLIDAKAVKAEDAMQQISQLIGFVWTLCQSFFVSGSG
jgi:hypothetical protein